MRHGLALGAAALAVAGCGGEAAEAQTVAANPPGDGQPPAAASLPAPVSGQLCDAPALAYLVGRPRTDIPAPVDPSLRVVACLRCAMPSDYRPDRTQILFDPKTGLVTLVKCG